MVNIFQATPRQHPRRQPSLYLLPWEPVISHTWKNDCRPGVLKPVLYLYRIALFDIFINCGTSSRHFVRVLAGESKTAIVFVDEKMLRTPAVGDIPYRGTESRRLADQSNYAQELKHDSLLLSFVYSESHADVYDVADGDSFYCQKAERCPCQFTVSPSLPACAGMFHTSWWGVSSTVL
jgi:hypothetical protein